MSGVTANEYGKKVHFGFLPPYFDKIDFGYPNDVTETYSYSRLLSTGTYELVAIVEAVFVDSDKCLLTSLTRTYVSDTAY